MAEKQELYCVQAPHNLSINQLINQLINEINLGLSHFPIYCEHGAMNINV